MKNVYLTLILLACTLHPLKADWYEINAEGKVLSFSRIAEPGKVSVFIISTNWCRPCMSLKNQLMNTPFDMTRVDFYYVEMAGDLKYHQIKNSLSYEIWRKVEGISGWPSVFIAAQTTNIVSSFSVEEAYPYERVVKVVEGLQNDGSNFHKQILMAGRERVAPINKGPVQPAPPFAGIPEGPTGPERYLYGEFSYNDNTNTPLYRIQLGTFKRKKPDLGAYFGLERFGKVYAEENGKFTVVFLGDFPSQENANAVLDSVRTDYNIVDAMVRMREKQQ